MFSSGGGDRAGRCGAVAFLEEFSVIEMPFPGPTENSG